MSYNVKTIKVFERQAKRLSKKYPSLRNELKALIEKLKEHPETGTPIGKNASKYDSPFLQGEQVNPVALALFR